MGDKEFGKKNIQNLSFSEVSRLLNARDLPEGQLCEQYLGEAHYLRLGRWIRWQYISFTRLPKSFPPIGINAHFFFTGLSKLISLFGWM